MSEKKFKFGLIGTSRVGTSIAWHLKKVGHTPVFVWNRSESGLDKARNYLKFQNQLTDFAELPEIDVVIISVSDDAIQPVAEKIAKHNNDLSNTLILHNSGFHSSHILQSLSKIGAQTGSLHPVISMPSIAEGIRIIPETVFTCEGEAEIELKRIADQIGRKGIIIDRKQKTYIHLAAVFVNNHVTTLIAAIKSLLEEKGVDSQDSSEILQKLSLQAANTWGQSLEKSLTGPVVRKDSETIKGHIKLLDNHPNLQEIYKKFVDLTVDLLSDDNRSLIEAVKKLK